MRRMFLAVLGVVAVAGVASAQQPQYQQPPIAPPNYAPAALPVQPTGGAVIKGDGGCTSCGSGATASRGFTMSKHGGGCGNECMLGYGCQNGCGSCKSDLAFHFGSCKQFFSPCGPTCGGGHGGGGSGCLFGSKCGTLPFAAPYWPGWACPRQYETYAGH